VSLVDPIEETGVGLRAEESMLIAAGQRPKDLDALLDSAMLPEMRKTRQSM